MATNHKHRGFALPVTLVAAAVSNQLIKVGDLAGVCLNSGEIGDEISVAIDEVFLVDKFADDDMSTIGTQVYLDATNKRVTLDANGGANIPAGKTTTVAAATVTSVEVKLNA